MIPLNEDRNSVAARAGRGMLGCRPGNTELVSTGGPDNLSRGSPMSTTSSTPSVVGSPGRSLPPPPADDMQDTADDRKAWPELASMLDVCAEVIEPVFRKADKAALEHQRNHRRLIKWAAVSDGRESLRSCSSLSTTSSGRTSGGSRPGRSSSSPRGGHGRRAGVVGCVPDPMAGRAEQGRTTPAGQVPVTDRPRTLVRRTAGPGPRSAGASKNRSRRSKSSIATRCIIGSRPDRVPQPPESVLR